MKRYPNHTDLPYKTPKAIALAVYEDRFGEDIYDHMTISWTG